MKTSYQINGLSESTMSVSLSGTLYFIRNVTWENYPLVKVTYDDNVLRMDFMPGDNLPKSLRGGGEHFIEVTPHEDFALVIKTISESEGQRSAFYCIVDTANIGSGTYFRVRKYTCLNYDGDEHIIYRADQKDPPEDGFVSEYIEIITRTDTYTLYEYGDK